MYYKNKIYSLKNYRSENYEELYVFLILALKELLLENIKAEFIIYMEIVLRMLYDRHSKKIFTRVG